MSYPADAFVRRACEEAHDGALLFVRGYWTMAARLGSANEAKPMTLILTGESAGALYGRFSDRGLCTAPGVDVELRIPEPEKIVTEGDQPMRAALVIPEDGGPQIWGRSTGPEGRRIGFTLNGLAAPQEDGTPYFIQTYEVWLTRDGKSLSDKPLFMVGA